MALQTGVEQRSFLHAEGNAKTEAGYLGHRMLFRSFEAIRTGMEGGPGMSLAWTFEYFLSSFSENKVNRIILKHIARLVVFPFRYLDHFLRTREGSYDTAAGFYFFGRKVKEGYPPKQLLNEHRGLNPG